jgi:hypothetical protein
LKSNKNNQAAGIAIHFQIDLNGKPVTKKSQFKERVSKNFLFWDREKNNTDNSLWATTLNAQLQKHTKLCKTWSVYLLLPLVMVWISLE